MVEQPRVDGVFQRARHAAISTLLNHYDGAEGRPRQRKIEFNNFIYALAKDDDFKAYARSLVDRPETRHHADRLVQALDQNRHLPGSGPFLLHQAVQGISRVRKAIEKTRMLELGVPKDELLPEPEAADARFPDSLWHAALSQAADALLSDLHREAALKWTVVVRNKRLNRKPVVVHESLIHLTPAHVSRLRQLAADAHFGSD